MCRLQQVVAGVKPPALKVRTAVTTSDMKTDGAGTLGSTSPCSSKADSDYPRTLLRNLMTVSEVKCAIVSILLLA